MQTCTSIEVAVRTPRPRSGARTTAQRLAITVVLLLAACARNDAPHAAPVSATSGVSTQESDIRRTWTGGLDSLRLSLLRLDSALIAARVARVSTSESSVRARFEDARIAFKRVEFLSAYYEPTTTTLLNGPVRPRVDEDEGSEVIFPPEGFQVVEEVLARLADSSALAKASNETQNMIDLVTRLRNAAAGQRISDDRVFDAAKLQVARIVTLGVTGFDSPLVKHSLPEAAAALRGIQSVLSVYRPRMGNEAWAALDRAFAHATEALESNTTFDAFDRFGFIVASANPLAHAIANSRDQLGVGVPSEQRGFRVAAVTLFDSNAFAPEAFGPPGTAPAPAARVTLGRTLFFDPALSGDGVRSCASCHDPAGAFTDGATRSMTRSGRRVLRNSPTIINAGLQVGSFYDARTTYLEDQVADVVGNPDEMHGNLDATAVRLATDSNYASLFAEAFAPTARRAMTRRDLRSAVAAYIRSLQALNSPVDRALRGDTTALSREARAGFNLFMGRAACATCHFAPLFNGTTPPMYQESEVEIIGVPERAVTKNARIDPDQGRFRITRAAPHMHAFKVPTIRNSALTAPYMHNGAYRTLESVVDFYNRGGGAGIGIDLPNQTLPSDSLGLSATEQRALVAFMRALTDTTGMMPPRTSPTTTSRATSRPRVSSASRF